MAVSQLSSLQWEDTKEYTHLKAHMQALYNDSVLWTGKKKWTNIFQLRMHRVMFFSPISIMNALVGSFFILISMPLWIMHCCIDLALNVCVCI